MDVLDIILQSMLLVEKLESFQIKNHYNIPQVQKVLKNTLRVLVPLAERDYAIVVGNDEETTQSLMREYESLVSKLTTIDIPKKMIINQALDAFEIDPKTIEATIHRVLKKKK